MHSDKIVVGARIRQLRSTSGLSMAALADQVGVASKSTINDWEKGRTTPNPKMLARLATTFQTSVGFLLHGELADYAFHILKTDGLNNSEFNVLLWEYVDLTTTNPNILSGDVFNPNSDTANAPDDRDALIDSHIDGAINQILKAVINVFPASDYPDGTMIIKSACDIFRQRIQLIRRTFTGKYNRIVRLLDNVDLYEKLGNDPELVAYVNEMTGRTDGFELNQTYQQKMNALMADFHLQLNALNADYQRELKAKAATNHH